MIPLNWQAVDESYFDRFDKNDEAFYSSEKTSYGRWIKLSSLAGYEAKSIEQLKKFSNEAKTIGLKEIVVIDIRGNGGGNSSWGSDWIKNLWGYSKIDQLLSQEKQLTYVSSSEKNRSHFKNLYNHLKKNGGIPDARMDEYLQKLLNAIESNPGKVASFEVPSEIKNNSSIKKRNFKGKVYLLTDSRVFSSGETFAQELRLMPNVTQVGIATNASTAYGDIRFDITPGGLLFMLPTKASKEESFGFKAGEATIPQIQLKYIVEDEVAGKDSLRIQLENMIKKRKI